METKERNTHKSFFSTESRAAEREPREVLGRFILIKSVDSDGAAKRSHIEVGDRIVAIEGQAVGSNCFELPRILQEQDGHISLKVLRNGNQITIDLIGEKDANTGQWRMGIQYVMCEAVQKSEGGIRFFENLPITFRNKEGAVFAQATVGIEMVNEKETLPEIGSFNIEYKDNSGEIKHFDVLSKYNHTNAKVLWKKDLAGRGRWDNDRKTVLLKEPFDVSALEVLLHELRHADQSSTLHSRFKNLFKFYTNEEWLKSYMQKQRLSGRYALLSEIQEIFSTAFPESDADSILVAPNKWIDQHESEINALYRELYTLGYDIYSGKLPDWQSDENMSETLKERLKHITQRWSELEKEWLDLNVVGSAKWKDVMLFPTHVMERDADFGALIALREIRKETGINFFQEIFVSAGGLSISAEQRNKILAQAEEKMMQLDASGQEQVRKMINEWLKTSEPNTLSFIELIDIHMKDIGVDKGCFHNIHTAVERAKLQNSAE